MAEPKNPVTPPAGQEILPPETPGTPRVSGPVPVTIQDALDKYLKQAEIGTKPNTLKKYKITQNVW